jgi:L-threonylcarbamoyladenylate synthase
MNVLKPTRQNIMIAANIVRNGGLVIYPTETVYGLGCNPFNVEAVTHLLEIKGKNRSKPLPVLAASIADVKKIAFVSPNGELLAEMFWPGSLTLVFPKKHEFNSIVTFGLDSVGLRIPDNDVALSLIRLSGGLLVGSSANKTAEAPPRSFHEISDELKEAVDVVIDGGPSVQGTPSTVVDLTSDEPKVLREGPISCGQIMNTLFLSD